MADDQRDALAEYFKISSRRPWNNWFLGPALSLPPQYREFKLKGELCIEYHQYGDPLNPTKNHVPFRLPFRATETIHLDNAGTTQAQAVRVSMDDPDDDEALKAIDNDRLEHFYVKGQYHPGVLCVKLLKYEGNSNSAFKTSTFRKLDFATLGEFIDFLTEKNLHQMSFHRQAPQYSRFEDSHISIYRDRSFL